MYIVISVDIEEARHTQVYIMGYYQHENAYGYNSSLEYDTFMKSERSMPYEDADDSKVFSVRKYVEKNEEATGSNYEDVGDGYEVDKYEEMDIGNKMKHVIKNKDKNIVLYEKRTIEFINSLGINKEDVKMTTAGKQTKININNIKSAKECVNVSDRIISMFVNSIDEIEYGITCMKHNNVFHVNIRLLY